MKTVSEAYASLCKNIQLELPVEKVPLQESMGRTLAKDICADRPFPPFHRVMMDGYAVDSTYVHRGSEIKVMGSTFAGEPAQSLPTASGALEVMTGCPLPRGADCIVPYEHTQPAGDDAILLMDCAVIEPDKWVHKMGQDTPQDEVLLQKNKPISPFHLPILATVGQHQVPVYQKPKAIVISTGDEVVSPDTDTLLPHQIRSSHPAMLYGLLQDVIDFAPPLHVNDTPDEVENALCDALAQHNIVIFTGGVSRGKKDFIPALIKPHCQDILCHGVRQRPGKPLLIAKAKEGQAVFGLPGNPLSCLVGALRYIRPWLEQHYFSSAFSQAEFFATQHPKQGWVQFVPVHTQQGLEGRQITALSSSCSGDLAVLAKVHGIIEVTDNPSQSAFSYFPGANQ